MGPACTVAVLLVATNTKRQRQYTPDQDSETKATSICVDLTRSPPDCHTGRRLFEPNPAHRCTFTMSLPEDFWRRHPHQCVRRCVWFSRNGSQVWCDGEVGNEQGWRGGGVKQIKKVQIKDLHPIAVGNPPEEYPWRSYSRLYCFG
jgi:hypothetical protein